MKLKFTPEEILQAMGEEYGILHGDAVRIPMTDNENRFLNVVASLVQPADRCCNPLVSAITCQPVPSDLEVLIAAFGLDFRRYGHEYTTNVLFGNYEDHPDRSVGVPGEADFIVTDPKQARDILLQLYHKKGQKESPYSLAEVKELHAYRRHAMREPDTDGDLCDIWIFPLERAGQEKLWRIRWRLGDAMNQIEAEEDGLAREYFAQHRPANDQASSDANNREVHYNSLCPRTSDGRPIRYFPGLVPTYVD